MLANVMRMLGVDLQQQANNLQARAEAFRDHAIDRAALQLKHTCLIAGLALLGGVLSLAFIGTALAGLYLWVDMRHGPLAGLTVIGAVTAIAAATMFTIAASVAKRKVVPPPVVVRPVVTVAPSPTVTGTVPAFAAMVPPPPPGAPLLDVVSHRFTAQAAAASDEAINSAVEFVRTGSRSALFGTLAITVLAGLLIGRRKP
jgi:hypothetical protein